MSLFNQYLERAYNESDQYIADTAKEKFKMLIDFGIKKKEEAEQMLNAFAVDDKLKKAVLAMYSSK